MTDTILYERTGHIARLVLKNPEQHNALGQEQLLAIQAHLETVRQDSQLRVLIITGWGDKTFCAGASLQQLGSGELTGDAFQETTDQIAALEIPTICAINGNVYGGGVELALSCDFRIGIVGSKLRVPAAAIGLCYPASGINRFVERLGLGAAKRMLLAAEAMSAETMHDLGFLDHLVQPAGLDEAAEKLAREIAALAPLAIKAMKHILQQAAAGNIDQDQARARADQCLQSEDLQEGFTAQREKRSPRFKGQ
ncbi:enoyl-CoA hydratase/isomerase family protein [Kineobactrum salinum]|uniref:Enoyl-CoA hydratase/isomerase family protein n=1 Tax=Kineobactrum salinum TaxID=2708301 RepID=A0A6C0U2B1_9GAMM|nr:enoyl-CoA hydratase/isomerase family protein [Kineobactrum salinum]QIB66290.1 enoyl-CoA hydratase/isomerase family protein [Kineobactrum salinum]